MAKVFLSFSGSMEKADKLRATVADALDVPLADVVLLPAGASVSVVDVPRDYREEEARFGLADGDPE
jgi:hypothetical protein